MVVPNLERAFDLDSHTIWLFLSKDQELRRTECGIELFWREVDIIIAGLKPARLHNCLRELTHMYPLSSHLRESTRKRSSEACCCRLHAFQAL